MICEEHRDYNPKCEVCVRADRIASTYGRALVAAEDAPKILAKGWPHNAADRAKLARAAESLDMYLAELER